MVSLPTSLGSKIGPLALWQWALGVGILMFAHKHWLVGGITGGGIQGGPMAIIGGGVGGYGEGYSCDDFGYCGGGQEGGGGGGGPGGGGGGKKKKGGGGRGGGGGGGMGYGDDFF